MLLDFKHLTRGRGFIKDELGEISIETLEQFGEFLGPLSQLALNPRVPYPENSFWK